MSVRTLARLAIDGVETFEEIVGQALAGAVGAIDDDLQAVQPQAAREAGLDELGVAAQRVVEAAGATPVWLKLAPDLSDDGLVAAVGLARAAGVRAVVATNTTLARPGVSTELQGGLSGRPLFPLAKDRLRVVLAAAGPLDVVGVGGIETAEQVDELLSMGCAAVQLYSSLVYEGPGLPWRLHRALAEAAVRRAS